MTSILIADDHPMIRSAISLLLSGSEFEPVAEAANARDAIAAIAEMEPEMILLDLAMPGGSGMDVLRQVRASGDDRPIVILTAEIDDMRLGEALALSVDGIVLKNSDPGFLLECLSSVRSGKRWLDPNLRDRAEAAATAQPIARLSPRERELVALVAQGLRNREIAAELGITEGTVKVYLHGIFEKLGVSSRTELALRSAD